MTPVNTNSDNTNIFRRSLGVPINESTVYEVINKVYSARKFEFSRRV